MIKQQVKSVARLVSGKLNRIDKSVELTKTLVLDINHRLLQYDGRLDRLRQAYSKVDPYQPLYGLSGFGEGQRGTRDRCDAIFEYFNQNVSGMRMLDVGCYAGWASFYFADRGAQVIGTDNREDNIEVCRLVKEVTGIPAEFKLEEFNPESISKINQGEYDIVMILSVLHWTVYEKGLEYVQDCMAQLMEKIPVLVVELAQKHEDKKLYWDEAVPENDLDIFAKTKDITIDKIGEFPTHLSGKKRPIYVVRKKHITVNGKNYAIDAQYAQAYKGAPKWRDESSIYYSGKDVFVKQYNYKSLTDQTTRQMINEINFFLQNESLLNNHPIKHVPQLIDFEITNKHTRIVFEKLNGELLNEHAEKGIKIKEIESIAKDLLDACQLIEEVNLYHNDLRSWNIIVNEKGKPYLIDFELVSTQQIEDNYISYLWVINTMLTGERESLERPKTTLPPRKNFERSKLLVAIYDAHNPKKLGKFSNYQKA